MLPDVSPEFARRLHYSAAVAWLFAIPVVLYFGLQDSLPFLCGISLYNIVVNHLTAGLALRIEVAMKDDSYPEDT